MPLRACKCGGRIRREASGEVCDRCGPLNKNPPRLPSHKRGYDWNWRLTKERFLERQNPARCVCCEAMGIVTINRGRTGLLVDHIVPASLLPPERFMDESNWQVLCHNCDVTYKKPLEQRHKFAELLIQEWNELLINLRNQADAGTR